MRSLRRRAALRNRPGHGLLGHGRGRSYTRTMPQPLDAQTLVEAVRAMLGELRRHSDELNRLNVFPVHDRDTGTNMVATLQRAAEAADAADGGGMRAAATAITEGALMGAAGNSGMILAEVLRGLCETWAPLDRVGPAELVTGFWAASRHADRAVLEPVEGTILTVVRATAEALEAAGDRDVDALLAVGVEAATRAVAATQDQLDVLRDAGVVDAAGRGFELCLGALASVVAAPRPPGRAAPAAPRPLPGHERGDGHAFEVQYLLACRPEEIEQLKGYLRTIGDSVAVTGDGGLYSVHVHTDDAGPAIEAAIRRGTPSRIRVARLGVASEADRRDG